MAKDGTEKVFGGTPYARQTDPKVVGTPNAFGLSPWSAFKARIAEIARGRFGEEVVSSTRISSSGVTAILFTTDIPVIVLPICTDDAAATTYITPAINALASVAAVTTVGGTDPASTPVRGKPVSGYTGAASNVPVTGFPAEFLVQAGGIEGVLSYADLMVVANSPVINGPVGPLDITESSAAAPVPILLLNTQYTEAIRANGNLLVVSGLLYQVVGVWALA